MERQYQNAQGKWMNEVSDQLIFERWGDDNTVYYLKPEAQGAMYSQVAPTCAGFITGECPTRVPPELVIDTPRVECIDLTDDLPHYIVSLSQGATLVVYLDAWKPWQTVPFKSYIYSPRAGQYRWEFVHYEPIYGPKAGQGSADAIIRAHGHTDRTPTGDFPVPPEQKVARTWFHNSERPRWILRHTGGPPIRAEVRLQML